MEPEMNSENWGQPSENQNQPDTSPQPAQNQQDWLQKTCLNVTMATWLQFLILIAILVVASVKIAPKFTSAQSRQQNTSEYYSEYEDECYDEYYDEYYYDD